MEKDSHYSPESDRTDTLFEIVGDVRNLHPVLPGQSEQILMGPVAQVTLFGHEVKQPISITELDRAYTTLAEDIAEVLAFTRPDQISFYCVNDPLVPRWHQFAYMLHDDGTKGFLKIGRSKEAKASLKYEIRNFEVAHKIGYPPVVKPLQGYTETRGGLGFFEIEWIDQTMGYSAINTLLAKEMLPAEYGRIVAEIMIPRHGIPIPPSIDTSGLRLAESEIESPEIFFEALHREQHVVLSPKYREEVEQLVGTDEVGRSAGDRLQELFDEVNEQLPAFLEEGEEEGRTYFCLNDWGPHTVYFCNEKGREYLGSPMVVYFLGYSGRAYNKMLVSLYDWGNFWTRCDPNAAMQHTFLETVLRLDPLHSLDRTYRFLRYIIIARTVFVAHARMEKDHPRHDTAASLLQNLIPNLEQFEKTYIRIIQTKRKDYPC